MHCQCIALVCALMRTALLGGLPLWLLSATHSLAARQGRHSNMRTQRAFGGATALESEMRLETELVTARMANECAPCCCAAVASSRTKQPACPLGPLPRRTFPCHLHCCCTARWKLTLPLHRCSSRHSPLAHLPPTAARLEASHSTLASTLAQLIVALRRPSLAAFCSRRNGL